MELSRENAHSLINWRPTNPAWSSAVPFLTAYYEKLNQYYDGYAEYLGTGVFNLTPVADAGREKALPTVPDGEQSVPQSVKSVSQPSLDACTGRATDASTIDVDAEFGSAGSPDDNKGDDHQDDDKSGDDHPTLPLDLSVKPVMDVAMDLTVQRRPVLVEPVGAPRLSVGDQPGTSGEGRIKARSVAVIGPGGSSEGSSPNPTIRLLLGSDASPTGSFIRVHDYFG